MKSYRIGSLVLAIAVVFILSSCSKKEDDAQKAAEQASKAAQQMAQNMTGSAGAAGAANKTPGVAIPAKTLASFLPSVSGYTSKGDPETMEMEMNGAKYSHATQEYNNGDKRIKVAIFDYNFIAGLSMAYSAALSMNLETNDVSHHSDKINGFPAWTDWNKKNNSGSVGVVVNDRVFVVVESQGSGSSMDDLKSAAGNINYSGIASAIK
jgi:hypothetical protein